MDITNSILMLVFLHLSPGISALGKKGGCLGNLNTCDLKITTSYWNSRKYEIQKSSLNFPHFQRDEFAKLNTPLFRVCFIKAENNRFEPAFVRATKESNLQFDSLTSHTISAVAFIERTRGLNCYWNLHIGLPCLFYLHCAVQRNCVYKYAISHHITCAHLT